MSIKYRPEIDGLRAVAVLSVVFCHANFRLFSGGYIGVDVFFVISGFLITSLIVQELKTGKFSFVDFWERRIRRIFPPLVVVIAVSMLAGWFLYLPGDYKMLGGQAAAQSIFVSNIFFKKQAGYFDTENIIKPLLHTWSLAVEEQFYLFFPVVIFCLWKYRPQNVFNYIATFALLSFASACVIIRHSPSAAFYLLQYRAWELMLGTLMALRPVSITGLKKEAVGWAGLTVIIAAVLLYTDKTRFPGAAALLPCIGACLIILSNAGSQNRVGKFLSLRLPVFIGQISYSLYLWHWPILAFVRYSGLIDFTPAIAGSCLLLAFILSFVSWKWIETPFRQKRIFSDRKIIYLAGGTAAVLIFASGLTIYFMRGVPDRLPRDVVEYAAGAEDINPYRKSCNKPKFDRFESGTICQSNAGQNIKPSFALWGDSFADAMAPAFYDLSKKYQRNGYILTAHGCPPMLEYHQAGDVSFDCAGFNEKALKLINEKKIKTVFLIGNWTDKLKGHEHNFRELSWYKAYEKQFSNIPSAALQHTIDLLQKNGVKVYLVKDVPYAPFDPPRNLAMRKLYHDNALPVSISAQSYEAAKAPYLDPFLEKNKKSRLAILDPETLLCDAEFCRVEDNGHSLYFNQGHISTRGAIYLEPLIEPYFKAGF